MAEEELKLTFGIELEHVFVFHERLLRSCINRSNAPSDIIKDIPDDWRDVLLDSTTQQPKRAFRYHGWGLTSDSLDPRAAKLPGMDYRVYGYEPLQIARDLYPPAPIIDVKLGPDTPMNHERWHFTHDKTLEGIDLGGLETRPFAHRKEYVDELNAILALDCIKHRDINAEHWSSHGIELVSKVLENVPESFEEINEALAILEGESSSEPSMNAALPSIHCGFHVHIGLPPSARHQQAFSLPLLRHLAYIFVMYERDINTLFPHHRREDSTAGLDYCEKNLFEGSRFLGDLPTQGPTVYNPATSEWERSNIPAQEEYSQSRDLLRPVLLPRARELLFNKDLTLPGLVDLMNPRKATRVNWTNLTKKPEFKPNTIEFRQHEGTLSEVAIKWWVTFLIGLVQWAGRLAREDPTGASWDTYQWTEWNDDISVFELFKQTGFPEEGVEYYRRKAAYYSPRSDDAELFFA